MKVHLKLPDSPETVLNLNLVPKVGEHIDYGGIRYIVISVVHTAETSRTTLEAVRVSGHEAYQTLKCSHAARYRTTEIGAYSPPMRSRFR